MNPFGDNSPVAGLNHPDDLLEKQIVGGTLLCLDGH